MKILCNLCQKEINEKYIDQKKGIARCIECNNVFDYGSQVAAGKNTKRALVKLPNSIRLKECDDCLYLEHLWRSNQLIFLTPFYIAWIMIPVLFYSGQLSISFKSDTQVNLYMFFHVLLGLALTYYYLAGLFNKTKITVSKGFLKVKDRPFYYFRNIDIGVDELDQLYAREKIIRGRRRSISWSSFEVNGITKSGKHFRLVRGLNTANQALYIEQQLENYLGIVDRAVDGEIQR